VWADWLADPEGMMVVAEYGGHAVGLGKATSITPGQWWLEGLRVDPKYQGLKIGSHIFEYLDAWWKEHASGAIRLMTSWERLQVHHLSERLGYDKLGEVRTWAVEAAPELLTPAPKREGRVSGDGFEAVKVEQLKEAAEFVRRRLADFNRWMDSGWQFSEPDETALRQKAEQHRLWWWAGQGGERQGLLACWEDDDDGERALGIGFAAVERDSLHAMLDDARRLAQRFGFARVLWLAPVIPWVEAVLEEAGFKSVWDGSAFLYGKEAR